MSGLSGTRRGGLRDLGECWFLCLSCPEGTRWQFGGPDGFAKHLRVVHGRDEWPTTVTVDSAGCVLDADGHRLEKDGEPVLPSEDVAGLITTRPTKPRLYREGR